MNYKKIQISIAFFMLLATIAVVSNSALASSPCTVSGYVYANTEICEPEQIILSFPNQNISASLFPSGFYIVDFSEEAGETGIFTVTLNGVEYTAEETITIQQETSIYEIDLNITVSDDDNGGNGNDDEEENGETGDDNGNDDTGNGEDDNGETGGNGDTNGGNSGGGGVVIPPQTDEPPVADAGGPYFGFLNENINFDGFESYAKDGKTIEGYRWDFNNDGTYDTDWLNTSVSDHIYTSTGEYIVTLQVKDDDDLTDTNTTTVTILAGNREPTSPEVTGETDGSKNISYIYTAVSTDPDNDTIKYVFDWDDGANTTSDFLPNATIASVNHSWENPGKYTVKVTAIDYHNATSPTKSLTVFIDAINVEEIGYLIDVDGDGIYDTYHSNDDTIQTVAGQKAEKEYLLDTTGDDEYNYKYIYNEEAEEWELIEYEPSVEPVDEENNMLLYVAAVLLVIMLLIVFFLATKKKGKK